MLPPLRTINLVLSNSRDARNYCIGNDTLIKSVWNTIECRRNGQAMCNHSLYQYRCPACRTNLSIRTGCFKDSKLSLHTMMHLIYSMLSGVSNKTLRSMSVAGPVALWDYYRFIREVMEDDLIANPVQIGGPRVIVEIDETKLDKRNYNRDHRVKGTCVFGGVERTVVVREDGSTRTHVGRTFMVRVDDRSAPTLREVLIRNLLPGSVIYSMIVNAICWAKELMQNEFPSVSGYKSTVSL